MIEERTIERFIISLVDLFDQSTYNAMRLHAYTILPKKTQYPYIYISDTIQMEEQPCAPVEYVTNCSIVTQSYSFKDALNIFYEVEKNIKDYLRLYFSTQTIIRFLRVRTIQLREDLTSVNFTLSIKR